MGFFDLFKRTKICEDWVTLMSKKVLRSEEVNRPEFDRYFPYVVKELDAKWDDDGYLVRVLTSLSDDDKIDYCGYNVYNDNMNEAVCNHFGKETCQKLAKAKGWYLSLPCGPGYPEMKNKDGGDDIFWWILHEELSKM